MSKKKYVLMLLCQRKKYVLLLLCLKKSILLLLCLNVIFDIYAVSAETKGVRVFFAIKKHRGVCADTPVLY